MQRISFAAAAVSQHHYKNTMRLILSAEFYDRLKLFTVIHSSDAGALTA